jgi:hypothetical protein
MRTFRSTTTLGSIGTALAIGALSGLLLASPPPRLLAQETAPSPSTPAPGPYAEQIQTSVRGLSEAEIADLRNGRGMGLARPAEINGYPGPRHVLDLAGELSLTDAQRSAVQALFEQMQAEAVPLGEEILRQYAVLEQSFRDGHASMEDVVARTGQLGEIEGRLRATHLRYHLLTRPLLTDEQNVAYSRLRGYTESSTPGHAAPASGAPAEHAPGHQPGMRPGHGH